MTKTEVLALISEKIKANGKGEITAEVLAEVLNAVAEIETETPLSSGIMHVGLYDVISADDLMETLNEAKVFGFSVGGDGGARLLPVSCRGDKWIFEYQGRWSIADDVSINDFIGDSWDSFLGACDSNSSPIVTEKSMGWVHVNLPKGGLERVDGYTARIIDNAFGGIIVNGSHYPRINVLPEELLNINDHGPQLDTIQAAFGYSNSGLGGGTHSYFMLGERQGEMTFCYDEV